MLPLDLEFQKRRATGPVLGILLLVLGSMASVVLLQSYRALSSELMQAEEQVTRLKRDVDRMKLFGTPSIKGTMTSASPGMNIRSGSQWEALFSGIEAAASDSVTLLAFEPGSKEISLRGEAKNFAAATKYIQRLSRVEVLTDVRMSEYETARDHPRRPIRFLVQAQWKEAPQ